MRSRVWTWGILDEGQAWLGTLVVWPVVEDPELDALSDTGAGMGGLAVRLDSGWNHAS